VDRTLEMPEELAPAAPVAQDVVQDAIETVDISANVYHAYQSLYFGFIALFALAGVDKFLHMLSNWEQYVAPGITNMTSFHGQFVASAAGVIEIILAVLIAVRPRFGAWFAVGWFGVVGINLILHGGLLEIALFDAVLMAAAVSFGFLARECN
jgi:uncharacterized membrane protein HdeD (DUF308 family)